MNLCLRFSHAGVLLGALLLASTPTPAQESRATVEAPRSIISLVPTPGPQGEILARHSGEATFEHAPANYHVFAAATVGQDAGVEVLTLSFAGDTKLTRIESKNKDFVIEPGGNLAGHFSASTHETSYRLSSSAGVASTHLFAPLLCPRKK
jgi:hypothetical protein